MNRLRDEAEHLEGCLIQVENARLALEQARREYEEKNVQVILLIFKISKCLIFKIQNVKIVLNFFFEYNLC